MSNVRKVYIYSKYTDDAKAEIKKMLQDHVPDVEICEHNSHSIPLVIIPSNFFPEDQSLNSRYITKVALEQMIANNLDPFSFLIEEPLIANLFWLNKKVGVIGSYHENEIRKAISSMGGIQTVPLAGMADIMVLSHRSDKYPSCDCCVYYGEDVIHQSKIEIDLNLQQVPPPAEKTAIKKIMKRKSKAKKTKKIDIPKNQTFLPFSSQVIHINDESDSEDIPIPTSKFVSQNLSRDDDDCIFIGSSSQKFTSPLGNPQSVCSPKLQLLCNTIFESKVRNPERILVKTASPIDGLDVFTQKHIDDDDDQASQLDVAYEINHDPVEFKLDDDEPDPLYV